jgi:geranylgeranyl diphosphate synthase type II
MAFNFASSLQACSSDLTVLRDEIDARLALLLPAADEPVGLAMREAVLAPGKRLRPLLLVLAARELECDVPELLDLGCAVEMIHAASLVLDDMPCMDDAQLRRGRPTLHVRFGEDIAALATVALLSHAFRTVASLSGLPPLLRTELVAVLADAIGMQGLVKGQYKDLREGDAPRPLEDVANANQLKTGALFAAALQMAALAARQGEAVRCLLRDLADDLGQAFQLFDDLLDGEAPCTASGKDCHKDAGKSTMVALIGREAARQRLKHHLDAAYAVIDEVFGPVSQLKTVLSVTFRC